MPPMIKEIVEKNLLPAHEFIYGFADVRGLLDKEFEEYPMAISIGKKLDDRIVDAVQDGPTLEYYHHYKEANRELSCIASNICSELERNGIGCTGIVPTLSLSGAEFEPYLENLRYKISHKMIATRAGLGWIGKTDLFVSKSFGPRLRLVSVLFKQSMEVKNQTVDKSRCGRCSVCVEKCPAQAATGALWDIHTDRDLFFDARKCYKKCGEMGESILHADIRICGVCVSVCPIGRTE
jgi:epoxyqueuosine reductase